MLKKCKVKRLSVMIMGLIFMAFSSGIVAIDDEPIDLAPVERGGQRPSEALGVKEVIAQPTPVPTVVKVIQVVPTPTARPAVRLVTITDLDISQEDGKIKIRVKANGTLRATVSELKNPERILLRFPNAHLPGRTKTKDVGQGNVVRARMAQHASNEVWLVVDLLDTVSYQAVPQLTNAYGLDIQVPVAPASAQAPGMATSPKINVMFFDLNVMFQGKQYEKFPCANFIYDQGDKFPLEREFLTTFVFYEGYGAFVGNVRILDPDNKVIDNTVEPFAFNLFNRLTDYHAERLWRVTFVKKGYHTLILSLNGQDVLKHYFYVGHNDDRPPSR
jgi:hypothetical protein